MRPTTPGYKDGVETGNFLTEDPYLGKLTDPLSLNRYNYVKSSAPNYVDPSGYEAQPTEGLYVLDSQGNIKNSYYETVMSPYKQASELQAGSLQERWSYFTEGIKGALNKAQENTLKKMIDRAMENARIEQCIDKLYIGSVSVMQSLSSLILGAVYGAFRATPFGALQSFIHELVGIEVGTHQDARDVLIGLGGNRTAFGLGEAIGKTVTTVLEVAALLILLFTGPGGAALSLATVGNATGAAIQAIVLDGTAIQIITGAGVGVSIALSGDSNAAKNQGSGENVSKGNSDSNLGNYKFKEGIDEDLRDGRGTFDEALEKAFEKTGTPKEDFTVTKWGKDQYGKSYPVEWRASNGAEVSVDIGHSTQSGAPTADHVGWQTVEPFNLF